jgi:hypothetical protein
LHDPIARLSKLPRFFTRLISVACPQRANDSSEKRGGTRSLLFRTKHPQQACNTGLTGDSF